MITGNKEDYYTYFPGDISRYFLPGSDRDKFTHDKISRFNYFEFEDGIESINPTDCSFKLIGNDNYQSINDTVSVDQFQACV